MQADNENKTLIAGYIEHACTVPGPIELSPTEVNQRTYTYTGKGLITADIAVNTGSLKAQLFQGDTLRDEKVYQSQRPSPPLKWSSKDEDTFTLKVQNLIPNRTTLFFLNGRLWQ